MTIDYVPLNPDFDDLPLLQTKPCWMSRDDIDFHSDILYLRALLDSLWDQAMKLGRAQDIPPPWSKQLDRLIAMTKEIRCE